MGSHGRRTTITDDRGSACRSFGKVLDKVKVGITVAITVAVETEAASCNWSCAIVRNTKLIGRAGADEAFTVQRLCRIGGFNRIPDGGIALAATFLRGLAKVGLCDCVKRTLEFGRQALGSAVEFKIRTRRANVEVPCDVAVVIRFNSVLALEATLNTNGVGDFNKARNFFHCDTVICRFAVGNVEIVRSYRWL